MQARAPLDRAEEFAISARMVGSQRKASGGVQSRHRRLYGLPDRSLMALQRGYQTPMERPGRYPLATSVTVCRSSPAGWAGSHDVRLDVAIATWKRTS